MNLLLGYREAEQNLEGDNPPIGIVLAREKMNCKKGTADIYVKK